MAEKKAQEGQDKMAVGRFRVKIDGPSRARISRAFNPKLFNKRMRKQIMPAMERAGHMFKGTIQGAILTKGASVGASWDDLAPRTKARKGHDFPLLETGEYIEGAFQVKVDKRAAAVIVGPNPPSAIHLGSGLPFTTLGIFMELGFFNVRAGRYVEGRPHVGPASEKAEKPMVRMILDGIRRAIDKEKQNLNVKDRSQDTGF